MNNIKIRIDYDSDTATNASAKQVVYLEPQVEEIDIKNLIGKTIVGVEYEAFYNCILLTLTEPEATIIPEVVFDINFTGSKSEESDEKE